MVSDELFTTRAPVVKQSGEVTVGHVAMWSADGVIMDGGTGTGPPGPEGPPGPPGTGDLGYVNIRDFGAVGDDFTDDTAAIQAAIDYAFANAKDTVFCPGGYVYRVTASVWVDPPGNMRVSGPSNPTMFNFSMSFIGGGESLSNDVNYGVTIRADDGSFGGCDYCVIVMGPGQGMRIAGLTIRNEAGSLWPTTFGPNSIGIGFSGGAGGSSRNMAERCGIHNFNRGIVTGWQSDG